MKMHVQRSLAILKMTVIKSPDHITVPSNKSHGGAYQYIRACKGRSLHGESVETLTVLLRAGVYTNVANLPLTDDVIRQR